jgi:hypothetical protein
MLDIGRRNLPQIKKRYPHAEANGLIHTFPREK